MTKTKNIMKQTLAFAHRLTRNVIYTMLQQTGFGASNTRVLLSWTAGYTLKVNIQSDLN